jgi:hypothetical protein
MITIEKSSGVLQRLEGLRRWVSPLGLDECRSAGCITTLRL